MSLRLAGAGGAVVLPADEGLIHGLTDCLFGWPAVFAPDLPQPRETLAVIAREAGGTFRLGSRYLDRPMTGLTVTSTVCAIIADLALGYCDALPGGTGLHCGAVRLGAGPLTLIAGPHRAGKSTLIARLALEKGAEIFCDDVLPITAKGQAVALGLAPRIRLPAVAALGPALAARLILADARYAYLRPLRAAQHGTRAVPAVLVALDRRPGSGPPRLHHLPPDAAIRLILQQTLTTSDSPASAMTQAEALLQGMTCVTLRYDDLDAAVALLTAQFSGAPRRGQEILPPLPTPAAAVSAPARPDLRLTRRPDVHLRTQDHGVFLWYLDSPMLWHLNPLGQAIWALLETPHTPQDIATLLCDVFPQVAPDQILTDVAAFLGAARADGLVTVAAP